MSDRKLKSNIPFSEDGSLSSQTVDIFDGLSKDEVRFIMYAYHPDSPYVNPGIPAEERIGKAIAHVGLSESPHCAKIIKGATDFLIALNNTKFSYWISTKEALYNLLERTRTPINKNIEFGDDKEMKFYETLIKCSEGSFEMISRLEKIESEIFGSMTDDDRDVAVNHVTAENLLKNIRGNGGA